MSELGHPNVVYDKVDVGFIFRNIIYIYINNYCILFICFAEYEVGSEL